MPTNTKTKKSKKAEPEQETPLLSEPTIPDPLPPRTLKMIPLGRILIPNAAQRVADAKAMAKEMAEKNVGILHTPIVEPHDGDYLAVVGRTRMIAWSYNGNEQIEVWVYDWPLTPQQRTKVRNIERFQRSDDWQTVVGTLYELVTGPEALSEQQLVDEYAIPRAKLHKYMPLAKLPYPLVQAIVSGEVSQGRAQQLKGLSRKAQEQVAAYVEIGEKVTDEIISESKRGDTAQVAALLEAPVQPQDSREQPLEDFEITYIHDIANGIKALRRFLRPSVQPLCDILERELRLVEQQRKEQE